MNIELQLLATMLYRGDFTPLIRGDLTEVHFQTDSGKALYNFITTYHHSTNGSARYPSMSVVRQRFKKTAIELPDPDPGDTVEALTYETVLEKIKADIREASAEMELIAQSSSDPIGDMGPILAKMKRATEVGKRSNHTSLAKGMQAVTEDYAYGTLLPEGLPWPWPSLQAATKGLQQKEVVILCGRPKSRKTFTALHVLVNGVKNHNAKGLIFTPEMPPRQCLLRVVADFCGLRYTEFKDGKMNDAEEARLFEAAGLYGQLDGEDDEGYEWRMRDIFMTGQAPTIDIIQSTGRDTAWLRSQIDIYGPDITLFDSFYRQHANGGKKYDNNGDWKAITAVSRDIKDMTMDTGTRTIATHQLNRGAEKSVGDLSNMALADAVGQDADMIIRVVTGKHEGQDRSALVFLGAREIKFDGVMINNVPSIDFSEIGLITNRKQVEALMKAEDEADEAEEAKEKAKTDAATAARKAQLSRGKKKGLTSGGAFDSAEAAEPDEQPAPDGEDELP